AMRADLLGGDASRMLDSHARTLTRRGLMWARRHRAVILAVECAIWSIAVVLASLVRYGLVVADIDLGELALALVIACAVSAATDAAVGAAFGRWRVGGFEDVVALGVVVLVTGLVLTLAELSPMAIQPLGTGAVA